MELRVGHWTNFLLIAAALMLTVLPVQASKEQVVVMPMGGHKTYHSAKPISRVAIGDETIADLAVLDQHQILITPKQPGATNLSLWLKGRQTPQQFRLIVTADKSAAQHTLQALGASTLNVAEAGNQLVLTGETDSLEQHNAVIKALDLEGDKGIDNSRSSYSSQVQIDIKIVEISKDRLQSAGFFLGKNNGGIARAISSPGNVSAIELNNAISLSSNNGFLPRSEAFNFIYGRASNGLVGIISLLENNGFAYTLAEPSLMAMSGQTAHFLAGGEFPVPIRGGSSNDNAVTIEYKEFGVRLSLTPTVIDSQQIALKVAPEVSDLDFNAGIQSGGVTVPALRVRRTDTTISLGDGESFVISGLISQNTLANFDKVPFLGDIPILGAFFQSKSTDRNDRELLMVVTPHLVNPIAKNAELPELPGAKYRNYEHNFVDFFFNENGDSDRKNVVPMGFSK